MFNNPEITSLMVRTLFLWVPKCAGHYCKQLSFTGGGPNTADAILSCIGQFDTSLGARPRSIIEIVAGDLE